jgi:hypothetical protein
MHDSLKKSARPEDQPWLLGSPLLAILLLARESAELSLKYLDAGVQPVHDHPGQDARKHLRRPLPHVDTEHGDLVTEDQDLHVLGGIR